MLLIVASYSQPTGWSNRIARRRSSAAAGMNRAAAGWIREQWPLVSEPPFISLNRFSGKAEYLLRYGKISTFFDLSIAVRAPIG
ncbi:MAG: hypothetical protein R3D52_12955 [Xanthobacteraceae bacterium]